MNEIFAKKNNLWMLPNLKEIAITLSVVAGLLGISFLLSQANFLLFHVLIELCSIGIMWSIFILVWTTRDVIVNYSVLFLGIAFFFIGVVDTLHLLSYKGMGVFPGNEPNLPTQLWIAGRYLQGISMFTAPFLLNLRFNPPRVVVLYTIVTTLLIASVFSGIFPDCFIEGSGLTAFKKGSEYVISMILAAAILQFYRQRERFAPQILRYILLAICASILSELFFTFYVSVYGLSNVLGHWLKIIAMLCLYKALIGNAIKHPFSLIFRELKTRERELQASEERFSNMFRDHEAIMLLIEPDSGAIIDANHAASSFYGYSQEQLCQMSIQHINTSAAEDITRSLEQAITKGNNRFSFTHRVADGQNRDVEVHSSPIMSQGKEILFSIIHDVTRRKQAEKEVLANENYLRTILETSADGFWVVDSNKTLIDVNDAYCRMSGYSKDELLTMDINDIDCEEVAAETAARIQRLVKNRSELFETRHRRKDGTFLPVEVSTTWIEENGGRFVCFLRDLTERRLAEEALKRSENLHRTMIANIGDVIVIIDKNGINKYKSPNIEQLFGWKAEDVVGISAFDNIHPDDLDLARNFFRSLMCKPGITRVAEYRYKCKDNSYKWIEFKGINLLGDSNIQGILGNYHDITERRQTAQELSESETRFKALHNASFGGIAIHDNGVILECNRGLSEIAGYSKDELIGMNGLLLIAEHAREKVMNNIMSGYEKSYETYGLRKNGEEFPLSLEGRNIPYKGKDVRVVEFRDITAQKKGEEEKKDLANRLQQAQKMEAIGTLAGGIAHDFNNILAAIIGYAEMAKDDSQPESTVAKDLDKVLEAGYRAKDLVQQILAFSRQDEMESIPLRPVSIVKDAITMLRPSLPSTIEINQHIASTTSSIFVDPTQIHQILMNLCTNAFHAMEDTGGKLDISLKEVTLSSEDLVQEPSVVAGTFIQLSVCDSGPGITPDIKAKVFDPYFTTKETGKGTGMGLAIIHGIVKSYGGFISLYSEPGKGTAFHVFLPVIEEDALTEIEVVEQIPVGKDRILFIEDEGILAEMGKDMLERLGYHVTVRNNSAEALETFQNQPDQFDLIITDQTMPGMTGADIARRMIQIRPDIPIILCTGYSTIISEEKAKSIGIKEFALKPLSKKDIAVLIRKVLDNS